MKRVLAIVGVILALLLVLLLVLPMLFHDRITERVKTAVNQNINAEVNWSDIDLSFFRHFPNLTMTLDDLTAVGVDRFKNDTLADVRHLGVSLSLPSVLSNVMGGSGPIVVRTVELDQPRLRLISLEDGAVNWDITKKTAAQPQAASKPMAISLRNVEIKGADIGFDNRRSKLKASLVGYNQSLSGDFSQTNVAVQTKASADTASVTFAGIPYLNRVRLDLDADVQADLANKAYTIKQTQLGLNDLELDVSGAARTNGKLMNLDLAFKAPNTNFRSILSLVPAVYAHDFSKLKTSGSFTMDGRIRGEYGDSAFPSFAINAKVNDAAFQYADLPLPARSIFMDLALTNPGGSPDSTLVNLSRFHLLLGQNPVDARLVVKTPVSDPNVDFRFKGTVDLADVHRSMKLGDISQLTGTVAADAAVRTRLSSIDKKQYDQVSASGSVDVAGLNVGGKTLPHPLAIQTASLRLRPERAELSTFKGSVGSSDLDATGSLDNLISYAFRDDTLRGTASVHSKLFNLDEWRSGKSDLQIIPVPAKIDFGLDATVDELTYDKLRMANAHGKLRVKDQRVTLENFQMNTLGGQIGVTGYYDTKNLRKPAFDVGLKMTKINIPSAFEAFTTVQKLAPVAKYASGQVTTDMHLNGGLTKNMMPIFSALTGRGTLQTSNVALHDFPAMNKIVDVTKLQILNNPTMQAIKTAFQIQQGRLVLQPFKVNIAGLTMNVAGSNGIDQSMQYNLGLEVPKSLLGGANQAVAGLASKAGINVSTLSAIPLAIQLAGTVTNPTVKVDVGSLTSSVTEGAQQAVKQAVTEKVDSAGLRAVQAAEQQAASIRQRAESLAATIKQTGYRQADSLTAKSGNNPLLQAGAKVAADKLRKESDDKAQSVISEAGKRADSLVAAARRQAGGK